VADPFVSIGPARAYRPEPRAVPISNSPSDRKT
jgi:hypothetical protein